ncbi:MAG TPA: hypothetical protein VHE78_17160 [Gemmatimonadaceae bacterium]|nr:hypothetical protein [Gemmatimonadaceae bacterium]
MSQRLKRYEDMHDRFSPLTIVTVVEKGERKVVLMLGAKDSQRLRFMLDLEPEPPHGIAGYDLQPVKG